MAKLVSLGLEHFRSFGPLTNFPLAPLTIITGPNSSGKSSIFKALLLLQKSADKEGLRKLPFGGESHGLGSFSSSVTEGSESDTVEFTVAFDLSNGAKLKDGISLLPEDERTIWAKLSFSADDLETLTLGSGRDNQHNILELIRTKERGDLLDSDPNEGLTWAPDYWVYAGCLNGKWIAQRLENPEATTGDIPVLHWASDIAVHARDQSRLPHLIDSLEYRDLSQKNYESVWLKDRSIERDDPRFQLSEAQKSQKQFVRQVPLPFLRYIVDLLLQVLSEGSLQHLGVERARPQRIYTRDSTSKGFFESLRVLKKEYDACPYVPADISTISDSSVFVWMFSTQGLSEAIPDLVRWIERLGLGTGIEIDEAVHGAYRVAVRDGNTIRDLADLGFGTAQLMPILLQLVAQQVRDRNWSQNSTLMIEEPEVSLHPNLQSKLADLFVDYADENRSLLIETHSEYLIRRLQYLVAQGECDPGDVFIYYLGPDPNAEDYVRTITLNEAGQLSQDFGPGFFDEATNIMVDLYKYGSQN